MHVINSLNVSFSNDTHLLDYTCIFTNSFKLSLNKKRHTTWTVILAVFISKKYQTYRNHNTKEGLNVYNGCCGCVHIFYGKRHTVDL